MAVTKCDRRVPWPPYSRVTVKQLNHQAGLRKILNRMVMEVAARNLARMTEVVTHRGDRPL